jgi:hypothetical protein
MKRSIKLLDQIIEAAELTDLKHKQNNIKNKASRTVGESWMVYHLKLLKESLQEENAQSQDNRLRD